MAKLVAGTITGKRVGTCDMCGYSKRNLLEHVNYWTEQKKHRNKIEAYCLECYRNMFKSGDQIVNWMNMQNQEGK
jgi:hypothetical protein